MNRISVTIGGRTLFWDISQNAAAGMLSVLVSSLGPAQEEGS